MRWVWCMTQEQIQLLCGKAAPTIGMDSLDSDCEESWSPNTFFAFISLLMKGLFHKIKCFKFGKSTWSSFIALVNIVCSITWPPKAVSDNIFCKTGCPSCFVPSGSTFSEFSQRWKRQEIIKNLCYVLMWVIWSNCEGMNGYMMEKLQINPCPWCSERECQSFRMTCSICGVVRILLFFAFWDGKSVLRNIRKLFRMEI